MCKLTFQGIEWSSVAIPNEARILVAPGRPCDTPYKEFRPA